MAIVFPGLNLYGGKRGTGKQLQVLEYNPPSPPPSLPSVFLPKHTFFFAGVFLTFFICNPWYSSNATSWGIGNPVLRLSMSL